jgi:hypothetical protein
MCLTNRRNGQHYKLMHFTHARNWQPWLLGGRIVPQEAWQNCVQQKPLLHVFSVCDPHLRGCVFKNGTEDFSSHICQNNGYLLFERCGSICLPCLWPNSLGPLYTPCQLLRKLSRELLQALKFEACCAVCLSQCLVLKDGIWMWIPSDSLRSLFPFQHSNCTWKGYKCSWLIIQSSLSLNFGWVVGTGLIDIYAKW